MKFINIANWNQLPESANALFEAAAVKSIYLSRPWFESLTSAVMEDEQTLLIACVVSADKFMAILPLVKSRGNIGYSLKHGYTPCYSLLLADDDQESVLACLVEGLQQLPLNALLLEPVADDDNNLHALQQAMQYAGFDCHRSFRFYNWILRLQGQSFQEYMATRPARLRNTLARKQRKLEREHGFDIRLFRGDEVPEAMSDYYAVYNSSWKANEQFTDLVDDVVAGFSRAGWSRLGVLYVNGKAVAAQLWFVHHGKASIFRLSYDELWKAYSPGSILTRFMMEYVIDTDKVEEIDFLTGNEAYKQDWMSQRRERFVLSCVKDIRTTAWYVGFFESLKHRLKGI